MADHDTPSGGDARFAAALEQYGRLLRLAIARVCPRHLGLQVDDLEQEARLRLWKALQGERPIEGLASYVYRVAATTAIDAIRRLKVRKEEQFPAAAEGAETAAQEPAQDSPDADRALDHRLLLEKVEGVLGRLESRRAQVLRLHLQGFTTTEMATLLGSSEPSARNLLHRALKELRERLRDEGITYAGD
jgi:RNA polymerase sigma-70 factor (ECF subfamily)